MKQPVEIAARDAGGMLEDAHIVLPVTDLRDGGAQEGDQHGRGAGDKEPWRPVPLHRLMAFLRDEFSWRMDWFERERLLTLNNQNDYVGSGRSFVACWRSHFRRRPLDKTQVYKFWVGAAVDLEDLSQHHLRNTVNRQSYAHQLGV